MYLVCVKDLTVEEYKLLLGKAKKVIEGDWINEKMFSDSWREGTELLIGGKWYAIVDRSEDINVAEAVYGEEEEEEKDGEEYRATIAIELKDLEELVKDGEMEKLIKMFLKGKCTLE